jgi:hypothetical protein
LEVPFERPRKRAEVADWPDYYALRERLIGFLESHSKRPKRQIIPDAQSEHGSGAESGPEDKPSQPEKPAWYRNLFATVRA